MTDALTPKLTARQQQILELIRQAISQTGAPPTRAEIASQLGFKSANAAEEHLQALARKGVIELVSGTSRGIRLRGDRNGTPSGAQLHLPIPGLSQLVLPLIGRVAAGSPILAQEHVDQTYQVEKHLFAQTPDYLLRVRGMSMKDVGILDGDLLAVKSGATPKMAKLWWLGWATMSPSNVLCAHPSALNCGPKTPTTRPSPLKPATHLKSKDWRSA